ncbi:hypothetical protein QWY84_19265 [Aquisalimonas lutea]|uniref:hypothetical protein n=1 Tax=Aquisalimonas lutea TaxID=1327750 RepID=UPI0025B601BC|nr:hypothetical protein [Aquisalimonas lutea]MDN3519752.1 hypothetical protein [Aquisalimonas lutea]
MATISLVHAEVVRVYAGRHYVQAGGSLAGKLSQDASSTESQYTTRREDSPVA